MLAKGQTHNKVHPWVTDTLALGAIVCALALRATVTESPQPRPFAQVSIFDQPYSLVIGLVLICSGLFYLLVYGPGPIRWPMWICLLFFLVGCITGFVNASDKRAAATCGFVQVSSIIAGLGLACRLSYNWTIRLILALAVAVGLANAVQSFSQVMYLNRAMVQQYHQDPNSFLDHLGIEPNSLQAFLFEHRLTTSAGSGYLTTRNSAGLIIVIALGALAAIWSGLGRKTTEDHKRKYILAVVCTGLVIGLALTRSKIAILGLLAAVGLLSWQAKTNWAIAGRLGSIILAAMGLIAAMLWSAGVMELPQPVQVRWQYWTATWQMIKQHPFGVGPGNFSYHYCRYKPPEALETVADPHNLVLSLVSQYGPLGLIGWMGLAGLCILSMCRQTKHAPPDQPNQTDQGLIIPILAVGMLVIRPLVLTLLTGSSPGSAFLGQTVATALVVVILCWLILAVSQINVHHPNLPRVMAGVAIAGIVTGFLDWAPLEPANTTWIWAMMGCGLARTDQKIPRPARIWLATGASVVVAAVCWIYLVRPTVVSSGLLARAYAAVNVGQLGIAHRELDRAISADPLSASAATLQARLYMTYSDQHDDPNRAMQQAARYARIAINRRSMDFKEYERLGLICQYLGDYQQAYNALQIAVSLYPSNERLWYRLGQVAQLFQRPADALAFYKKAVEIEDRFRTNFTRLYPDWPRPVSRLGHEMYMDARQRIGLLQ